MSNQVGDNSKFLWPSQKSWTLPYEILEFNFDLEYFWNWLFFYYEKLIKSNPSPQLKVSKFQKQIFLFSFSFLPLGSKMGQTKKLIPLLYQIPPNNMIKCLHFFDLTHFRGKGRIQKNNFVRFLVQMRTRKFASEIYWPLSEAGRTRAWHYHEWHVYFSFGHLCTKISKWCKHFCPKCR